MRLWIGLHLPLLPLESFRPRWCEPGMHVVIDHDHVVTRTPEAAAAGVRLGMRRGGVAAVCPGATLHERDTVREQAALDSVALTLLQYTPEVAHAEECSLLMDVGASLRAFGGLPRLCRLLRASMDALGFTVRLSTAPTAQGAWLLARYPAQRRVSMLRRPLKLRSMRRRLDTLVFGALPAARPHTDWLEGIGCRTLGDVRKLPRAGLQRRCGEQLLDELDRAYGDAPELFAWVTAPHTFSGALELPDRIEHADAVLFGARRLLLQMTGWLSAHHLAVTRFVLLLDHERGRMAVAPTAIEIALAEPAWQEQHLTRLLKERLGRIVLPAAVIALRLQAAHAEPMAPPTEALFPEPGGTPADFKRLLELLTARLGVENVLTPAPLADYRPEAGNGWTSALQARQQPAVFAEASERPFWLLEKPIALPVREHRPFYRSPLKLLRGPERIECGWWDNAMAVRDYFVAQGAEAACYWVYRTRGGEWFLHGLFG